MNKKTTRFKFEAYPGYTIDPLNRAAAQQVIPTADVEIQAQLLPGYNRMGGQMV